MIPRTLSRSLVLRLAPSAPLSRSLHPAPFCSRHCCLPSTDASISFPRFNGLFFPFMPRLRFFPSLVRPRIYASLCLSPRLRFSIARFFHPLLCSTLPLTPFTRNSPSAVPPRSKRSPRFSVSPRRLSSFSLPPSTSAPFSSRSVSVCIRAARSPYGPSLPVRVPLPVFPSRSHSSRRSSSPTSLPPPLALAVLSSAPPLSPSRYPIRGSIEADALSSNHAESAVSRRTFRGSPLAIRSDENPAE